MVFHQNNIVYSFIKKKMHQFLLILLLIFSIYSYAQSSDGSITGKRPNTFLSYYNENVTITTEGTDTEFSGIINFTSNQGSVRIIPQASHKIILKPISQNNNFVEEEDSTVVGSRNKGTETIPWLSTKSNKTVTFPIPANQYLNISSDQEICKYIIYDANINRKNQRVINCTTSFQITVSFLSKGNYILVLETKNSNHITKYFIKN